MLYQTNQTQNRQRQSGFTLLEMMIVIAILGVIAAFAIPNYNNYLRKAHRTDMMSKLQEMASKVESQKLAQGSYSNITVTSILGSGVAANGVKKFPENANAFYNVKIVDNTNNQTIMTNFTSGNWEIIAEPVDGTILRDDSKPMNDGNLKISFNGTKCHKTTCGMDDAWRK